MASKLNNLLLFLGVVVWGSAGAMKSSDTANLGEGTPIPHSALQSLPESLFSPSPQSSP